MLGPLILPILAAGGIKVADWVVGKVEEKVIGIIKNKTGIDLSAPWIKNTLDAMKAIVSGGALGDFKPIIKQGYKTFIDPGGSSPNQTFGGGRQRLVALEM